MKHNQIELSKSPNLGHSIKQILIEWCQDTTSHGFLSIVKAQNLVLRLVWIVCLLASAGFCMYLIVQAIASYASNPISTTISIVDDVPAVFPTVSMCNLSPYVSDDPQKQTLILNFIKQLDLENFNKSISFNQISYQRQISLFLSQLNSTQKKAFGNTLENSLFSCKFNSKSCEQDDFEWYFDFKLGNCYKFNPNGSFTVGKAGYLPSLQMQFVIGDSSSRFNFYSEMGIRLLIHNSSVSYPLVYENGLSLAPGFNYDIKVSRTFYSRLGAPYSDCLKDASPNSQTQTSIMETMFSSLNFSTYDQQYCQNLVFQTLLAENCSCVDPAYINRDRDYPKCITVNQVKCQNDLFQVVYADPDRYFGENCPSVCDFFKYWTEISQSAFPTEWFYDSLKLFPTEESAVADRISKIKSYDDAKSYFVSFNIYYNELTYELVQEDPYWDIFMLFSNIGGNLGLFVGMSFLSFVEFFELGFHLVGCFLESFCSRRKTSP